MAAFSFPEASKFSFLTGESLILRFSSEVAAYSKQLSAIVNSGDASLLDETRWRRTCLEGVSCADIVKDI
jgi:hypothetical protein